MRRKRRKKESDFSVFKVRIDLYLSVTMQQCGKQERERESKEKKRKNKELWLLSKKRDRKEGNYIV